MAKFYWLLFLFVFSPQLAWASSQQVSLALDQTVFSLAAVPGEEVPLEINVSNPLDKRQLVSSEIADLSIGEDNKLDLIVGQNELFGMKDWIFLEEKSWIFEPKETKKISLRLKIPEKATVGSHYGGIFFRVLPEIQGDNFQNVLVGAQIGCYILLNVEGVQTGGGRISDFQAPILAKEKNDLKVEFENTGNIHYIPHGEIAVKNLLSQKEEKLEMEKHFVFPGKKYAFENNWPGGSAWGVYLAKAFFVDGNQGVHLSSRWIFGKYSFLWLIFLLVLFSSIWRIKNKFFPKSKKDARAEKDAG